tara:strand:- start:2182 stop:3372 length:1191 start_codon:yes stop_codon:yes gene_type:complete
MTDLNSNEQIIPSEKIHLPISSNYVEHWGMWEAVREVLQNAIDTQDFSVVEMRYNSVLKVLSRGGSLDLSSLMLGESSKRDDSGSIGKYGEGYKLALLVFCRSGYEVIINNGRDNWRPAIEKHPQLEVDCLTINVFKDANPEADENEVAFTITGLTHADFDALNENYLDLVDVGGDDIEIIAEHEGSYCFTDEYAEHNKVFVGGLFVCNLSDEYRYSYNFAPDKLELDRDRGTVDSFYLEKEVTQLFSDSGNVELLIEMATANCKDVSKYYTIKEVSRGGYHSGGAKVGYNERTLSIALDGFKKKHGDNAYAIGPDESNQSAIMERCVKLGFIPVQTHKVLFDIIKGEFKGMLKIDKLKGSISSELEKFVEINKRQIRNRALKRLTSLIDAIKLKE